MGLLGQSEGSVLPRSARTKKQPAASPANLTPDVLPVKSRWLWLARAAVTYPQEWGEGVLSTGGPTRPRQTSPA